MAPHRALAATWRIRLPFLLAFFFFSCYIYSMTITQTVDIPANRLLTIKVPPQIPIGKTILTFTPAPVPKKKAKLTPEEEAVYFSANIEWLNKEAEDVLSYQDMPDWEDSRLKSRSAQTKG